MSSLGRPTIMVLLVAGLLASGLADSPPISAAPPSTTAKIEQLCGPAQPGQFTCFGLRRTDGKHVKGVHHDSPADTPGGYAPNDLLSAYSLPQNGGSGQTVAIVDAYDDPSAEADLSVYRAQYGLPACTTLNGCFRKVDEWGGDAYPQPDEGWGGEESLDLDMVSAIAPEAHIILVEAATANTADLGTGVNEAVALGAKFVSNSYGSNYSPDPSSEDPDDPGYDAAYFNHPGVAIIASAGDDGYGVSYPAASPYVTAVGGTTLTHNGGSWQESAWNSAWLNGEGTTSWGATGSGCSAVEPKPLFQTDGGCPGRTVADVSAVADPVTGVAVYDTDTDTDGGWGVFGGTSAAAPIIAGVYALAGAPAADTYPNSYPYEHVDSLHDVTTGDDASCGPTIGCGFGTAPDCDPAYLCQAAVGYDGPTGLGTPDGTDAFTVGPHAALTGTVTNARTKTPVAGATVTIGTATATTDTTGHFQVGLAPGTYPVTIAAYGYAQANIGSVTLADGDSIVRNAALTPLATETISGVVTDGSGHGWGLYAKLTVAGVPGGPVYTDPTSGRYTFTLPRDATYRIDVDAIYPGYQSQTVNLTLGRKPAHINVALPIDTTGVAAPGYAVAYHGGGLQSFDTQTAPDGWTVVDNTDSGGWEFDDPLRRGNLTGGNGAFAIVDDYALGWKPVDTEMISPTYDLSRESAPQLTFDTDLPSTEMLEWATADVDASTDGGATWTNIWEQADVLNGPAHVAIPLTAYAGQSSVTLRFHFVGSLSGFWELDNIAVGTRTVDKVPGGLVVGQVTDANTRAGITGANVTADAATAVLSTSSLATTGDSALDDGLYWLFVPKGKPGATTISAAKPGFGYQPVTRVLRVMADHVTPVDLRLRAGRITARSKAITAHVGWGATTARTMQLTNTGTAPVTFSIAEEQPSATGITMPPTRVGSAVSPLALATTVASQTAVTASASRSTAIAAEANPSDAATWSNIPNQPVASYGAIAAADNGTLYTGLGETFNGAFTSTFSSYDPGTGSWQNLATPTYPRFAPVAGFIDGHLYVAGGRNTMGDVVGPTEAYDPATNTWATVASDPEPYGGSGSAVLGGKLYVIGGCNLTDGCLSQSVEVYDPAKDTWTATSPYPVPVSFLSCGAISGRIYCAGGAQEGYDSPVAYYTQGYTYDPATAKWSSIADMPADLYASATTVANGQLLVSTGALGNEGEITNEGYAYDPAANAWTELPPAELPLTEAAGALGFYLVGGAVPGGYPMPTVQVLAGYDQVYPDLTWLSERTTRLTLKPGQSTTVTVDFDATGMGPDQAGPHTGVLVIVTDTPYRPTTVPVTMVVVSPAH